MDHQRRCLKDILVKRVHHLVACLILVIAVVPVSRAIGREIPEFGPYEMEPLDYGPLHVVEIGNYVWVDENGNGIQDDGPTGVDGVTVARADPYGGILTTTTTAGGYYTFSVEYNRVYTIGVIADNFAPGGPLEAYTSTVAHAGTDDTIDSDGEPVEEGHLVTETPIITDNNYTFDFGLVEIEGEPSLTLGNFVWYDADDDGVVDSGEEGVPGVDVALYQDSDGSGGLTSADQLIDTTTTDSTGHYTFTQLSPSSDATETYLVVIPETNFASGGPLDGHGNSAGSVDGNSDLNDRDHGVTTGTLGDDGIVVSTPVSLTLGSEPTDDGDDDADTNLTLDFGFYQMDLGDLPEGPYPTTLGQDGARHIILPSDNPTLGDGVDAEFDGQPDATATGDDVAGTPDDEDGVQLASPLVAGEVATLTVTALNATDAYLNAWMDFDGDGVLESIFTDTPLVEGANTLTFVVPTVTLSDTLNARFRFSTQSGLSPTGRASDGEVEDYQFPTTPMDLGDLPEGPYPTTLAENGARHVILDEGNPTLGTTVDAEVDGQPNIGADGDDVAGVPDDEDGVSFSGPLVPGEEISITVTAAADADGVLNAWLDLDGDGSLTGAGEQIAVNESLGAGDSTVLVVAVPADAPQGTTTYARFRFSTDSGLTPTGLAPDGEIEDYAVSIRELDYGDAPDADYATLYASDGARHVILPEANPTLGSLVDAETDGQPSLDATGDDSAGTPDDEDGITFDTPLVPGEVATLTVSAAESSDGVLNAWVDFGGDGDWSEPVDQIAADLPLAAGGSEILTFTVPADATQDLTYARFRFSTDSDLTPTGLAPDGEIEDYAVSIRELDYGDAPDADYATLYASDGARHVILPEANPTLGSLVDAETDGQPSLDASGDDVVGTPDDEDGVTFDTPLVPGAVATLTVSAAESSDGVLNAWVDFGGDGDWSEPVDQIAADLPIAAGGSEILTFTVPADAVQDLTYARFRFSIDSGLTPTGLAPDGEIEDYAVSIRELDYGDAPDADYATLYASDGARHVILPEANPTLGATVDAETDGQPSLDATGDDVAGMPDDEDGVTFDTPLVPGEVATLTVSAAESSDGILNAWIDFGGDGDWSEPVDQIAVDLPIAAGGSEIITFTVPADAVQDLTYARFRFSTDSGLTPTGLAPDGEIEDYALNLFELEWEYGDLPDGPYPTLFASDGARHILDGVTYLGSIIDTETDGQPSTEADGDDAFDASDDEDGVRFLTPLMPGQPAQIQVESASNGYLNAWIDFDGDGTLDTIDVITIDGAPVVSTMNDFALSAGVHTFTIQVPEVTLGSSIYSRFRFTSYDPGGVLSYTGPADDGEVEDYVLMSLGNVVWLDDGAGGGVRNDGALNGAEDGISGVTVELYRADQEPDSDTPIATTTTDAGGYYTFTGLAPDTYIVHIPASMFGSGEPLEGLASSTGWGFPDDDLDQEQDENGVDEAAPATNGVSSLPVTLSLGDEPTGEDGDANSNLTVDFAFFSGRIGDYVWLELVRDGLQNDLFETPIPDVMIDLYDSVTGERLASTVSDDSGFYLFDDLPLGVTYTIQLAPENFAPSGVLYPYTPTLYLGGAPLDNTDSNANPDDVFDGAGYAVTTTLTTIVTEDLTLDFGFYPEPDLEVEKTVSVEMVTRNMPFTYTIQVTNTGQLTLDPLSLTDTLPDDVYYVAGSGNPTDPDVIAEPLLVWEDLGVLEPGDSMVISFAVTATPGLTGTYVNVVTATGITPPGDIITDTDEAIVDVGEPSIALDKRLTTYERNIGGTDFVTFTIDITNTGPSVIHMVPLLDQYVTEDLGFIDATPYPDEAVNGGALSWYDLTAPAPYGFGRNLLPGEAFHVTTMFVVQRDITRTTNIATVSDVEDVYQNPAEGAEDSEIIVDVPTGVELLHFRVAEIRDQSVHLTWATAAEIDTFGFHLYRASVRDRARASLVTFMPSEARSGTGAAYAYTDTVPSAGGWWYWLADVSTAGEEVFHGPVNADVDAAGASQTVYLPLILRGR